MFLLVQHCSAITYTTLKDSVDNVSSDDIMFIKRAHLFNKCNGIVCLCILTIPPPPPTSDLYLNTLYIDNSETSCIDKHIVYLIRVFNIV